MKDLKKKLGKWYSVLGCKVPQSERSSEAVGATGKSLLKAVLPLLREMRALMGKKYEKAWNDEDQTRFYYHTQSYLDFIEGLLEEK